MSLVGRIFKHTRLKHSADSVENWKAQDKIMQMILSLDNTNQGKFTKLKLIS